MQFSRTTIHDDEGQDSCYSLIQMSISTVIAKSIEYKRCFLFFFCFLYGQVPTVEKIMSKQENRWNRWMLPEGMQYAIVECVAW